MTFLPLICHFWTFYSISGDRLATFVYYKPTDTHTYLKYESFHPQTCKNSIPYSQLLRLRRICSVIYRLSTEVFRNEHFLPAAWISTPQSVLKAAQSWVEHITQDHALRSARQSSSERIPLVFIYHPLTAQIRKIVRQNLNILQADSSTRKIFSEPPLTPISVTSWCILHCLVTQARVGLNNLALANVQGAKLVNIFSPEV